MCRPWIPEQAKLHCLWSEVASSGDRNKNWRPQDVSFQSKLQHYRIDIFIMHTKSGDNVKFIQLEQLHYHHLNVSDFGFDTSIYAVYPFRYQCIIVDSGKVDAYTAIRVTGNERVKVDKLTTNLWWHLRFTRFILISHPWTGTVYIPSCLLCPGSCSLEKVVRLRRAAEAHPGVAKAISSSHPWGSCPSMGT